MKIVFISDTHGKHEILTSKAYNNILGEGDILVHAGDCTNVGKTHEIKQFLDWFSDTPFKHKVFIAGNHDWGFETNHDIAPEYKEKGVHYLFDNMVEIDGVKIYGSPWQPEFYDWAFNLPRGEKLAEKWAQIPGGLDILITYGDAESIIFVAMYLDLFAIIGGDGLGGLDIVHGLWQLGHEVGVFLYCSGHVL